MKAFRFIGVVAAVAVLMMPLAVNAQTALTIHQQLIAQHCTELGTILDSLQRRDLVSRTNLGHEYEVTAKLFAAFSQRVRNNNIDNQPYEKLITQFKDATTRFREAYVHYDDSLNTLKDIDCETKPGAFESQLVVTRSLRDTAEGASTHAASIVGQYRALMVQTQAGLPEATAKGASQ